MALPRLLAYRRFRHRPPAVHCPPPLDTSDAYAPHHYLRAARLLPRRGVRHVWRAVEQLLHVRPKQRVRVVSVPIVLADGEQQRELSATLLTHGLLILADTLAALVCSAARAPDCPRRRRLLRPLRAHQARSAHRQMAAWRSSTRSSFFFPIFHHGHGGSTRPTDPPRRRSFNTDNYTAIGGIEQCMELVRVLHETSSHDRWTPCAVDAPDPNTRKRSRGPH